MERQCQNYLHKKSKLLKYTAILVITFFLIEFISYIFLKFDSTELFNIRNYIEKTNDKRHFTLKRNHSSGEINPHTKKNWSIISSNERLRITKYDNKITHYLTEDNFEEKFYFLVILFHSDGELMQRIVCHIFLKNIIKNYLF